MAQKPPHPGDLQKVVSRLAAVGAISFGEHAFDRALERGIDINDAKRVLQSGYIKGDIDPGRGRDEWKCKIVGRIEGSSRWLGVVAVVIRGRRLYVITVEWEDA